MHYHQKGTIVKLTERPPKRPRIETVAAILRVPRVPRGGARCIVGAVSVAAFVLLHLSLGAAPALAAQPPEITNSPEITNFVVDEVRATRATAITPGEDIVSNGIPTTEAGIEFASSPSGPWVKYTRFPINNSLKSVGHSFEHLKPESTYYVRAFAVNSAGSTTTAPLAFTTHAPEAPEIGRLAVPEIEVLGGEGFELGATYAAFRVSSGFGTNLPDGVETNGADTEYDFEYSLPENGHVPAESSPSWAPFTTGASNTVTAAEDIANPEAKLTGLAPGTEYYARFRVTNAVGSATVTESFETKPSSPGVGEGGGGGPVQVSDLTGISASVDTEFQTRGYETHWRLQYSSTGAGGPWTTGAEGTVAAVAASELFASEQGFHADATITGLNPSTTYYMRIVLDNGNPPEAVSQPVSFQTVGPPSELRTFAVHTFDGESLRVLGAFDPHAARVEERQTVTLGGSPSGGTFTLGFDGETTTPIAFDARPAAVTSALRALGSLKSNVSAYGNPGGPYTIAFGGPLAGVDQPQLSVDASALTPSGTVTVATAQAGLSYDAHYHFEYVTQQQFEAEGFAGAVSAPEVDLGTDEATTQFVGEDLPGLQPGTTYHFRLAAKNSALPGEPLVYGLEQTLTAPAVPRGGGGEACPNQVFRVGPSANLPDCRAYELVTPPEKGGTLDFDTYGQGQPSYLVGEGGEHVWLESTGTQFGPNADPSVSSYFFARSATGWGLTSATVQPQAGIYSKSISVFSSDLTLVALRSGWETVPGAAGSPEVTFEAGPPGGPYAPVVSVPSRYREESAWAAASGDFSKLVLQTSDHELLGEPSGTKQGNDLYEYAEGQLRQVNVDSEGTKLGVCGARMALGTEGSATSSSQSFASPHAVSANGSRVFFEAVPGSSCGAAADLYMRSHGSETLDIGPYHYLAANPQGSQLLLEKPTSAGREIFLYDTETQESKLLFSTPGNEGVGGAEGHIVRPSADLSTVYFSSGAQLTPEAPLGGGTYRYEVATEKLRFLLPGVGVSFVSPDGRYLYFRGGALPGVPGGVAPQVYRYDSVEDVVQCMSCASPFDPEPKLVAVFKNEIATDGVPGTTVASANGDYVFFETPSALVPQDVDGEIEPSGTGGKEPDALRSRSSDVYEWRKPGVDGCVHVQGCLALISGGKGGYKTEIAGIADEGRDVFFATHEALVAQDRDGAGDIYDARIGGGFAPPPPRPVECEGDACSTPASPPMDATPSSFAFSGPGNTVAPFPSISASTPKAKPKKAKPKKSPKKKTTVRKKHGRRRARGKKSTANRPGQGKGRES